MKKFVALLGVLLIAVGIRLYNNGLLNSGFDGAISVGTFDTEPIDKPLLINGPHRMDIEGGDREAEEILANLSAETLFEEQVGETRLIYAHSPRLGESVKVHGEDVNLMIAVSNGKIAAGTPLLYGSY